MTDSQSGEIRIWERRGKVVKQAYFGLFMLLVCVYIFFGGLRNGEAFYVVSGVLGFVLFAASFVNVVRRVLVRVPLMTINSDGITDSATLTSIGFIPWEEIMSVTMSKRFRQVYVDIAMRDEEAFVARLPLFKRWLLKVNYESKNGLVSIPLGTSELSPAEIREVLECELKRHGRMLMYE